MLVCLYVYGNVAASVIREICFSFGCVSFCSLACIEVRSSHISYPAMGHMREPEPKQFTAMFLSIRYPAGSTTTGSLTFCSRLGSSSASHSSLQQLALRRHRFSGSVNEKFLETLTTKQPKPRSPRPVLEMRVVFLLPGARNGSAPTTYKRLGA